MTKMFFCLAWKEQNKAKNTFKMLVVLYKLKVFLICNLCRGEKLIKNPDSKPVQ